MFRKYKIYDSYLITVKRIQKFARDKLNLKVVKSPDLLTLKVFDPKRILPYKIFNLVVPMQSE